MAEPLAPPETARLEALRRYELLNTLPEETFDDITFLAAYIYEAPIALIPLVDANRQWFKSKVVLLLPKPPAIPPFAPSLCLQDVLDM